MFDNPGSVSRNLVRTGCLYYAIIDSNKNKLWDNFEDDDSTPEDSAERIKQDLELIRRGNTAIYTIHHYREKPANWKKADPDYISTYKQSNEEQRENYNSYRGHVSGQNDQILSELRSLHQRLDLLETDSGSETDDELEDQAETNYLGALNNPVVQQILLGLAGNLFKPQQPTQPGGMAGIESNIEAILKTLYSKGVTIDDLQKLSEMPLDKISFLLSMLRGNG